MRKFSAFVLLAFCLGSSMAYARDHSFQTGKLVNVTIDERVASGESDRRAIFIVQLGDIVYTLRGDRVKSKTKDYAKGLIIGDPVQVSLKGEDVILMKPDGKNFKTTILKRERIQTKDDGLGARP